MNMGTQFLRLRVKMCLPPDAALECRVSGELVAGVGSGDIPRPQAHRQWAEPAAARTQRMVRVRLSSQENSGS